MSQLMQLPEPEKSKQVHDYGLGETRHHEFFVEEPIFVEEVEAAPDSLLKVSGLEPLQEVCRQFGIDFVAHGSAVRRLLEHPRHSIFDLAPFLSDVDLIHTGSSAQTAAIESAVRKEVPFAECLRLQVRSREAATGFEIAAAHSGIIPAATPRLSTNEGLLDSWDGLRDIRSKEFRYIKNGFFHSSPLRKTGDDLDVMSVLLYLRILFESDGTPAESAIEDCRRVLAETLSSSECLKAIGKNDGLAARLAYSLYSLRTVVSVRKLASRLNLEEFDAFLEYLRRDPVLERIAADIVAPLETPGEGLIVSAHLKGMRFRFPSRSEGWLIDSNDATESLLRVVGEFAASAVDALPASISLDRGLSILAASPLLTMRSGQSPSSRQAGSFNSMDTHEFVHFMTVVEPDFSKPLSWNSEDLSVIAAIYEGRKVRWVSTVPSDCRFVSKGRSVFLQARCNLGAACELLDQGALQVYVTGWMGRESGLVR